MKSQQNRIELVTRPDIRLNFRFLVANTDLFFRCHGGGSGSHASVEFVRDREYLGTVQGIHLNADYCAVRFDGGKLQLHLLESTAGGDSNHVNGGEDEVSHHYATCFFGIAPMVGQL